MAGLHFDITGDNSSFMNALKETEKGIKSTAKSVESSGMGIEAMFGKLSKAAAGLGVAFSAQQFIGQITKVRGEFQQLEVAFETMLGSTEKASALMAQLTKTAAVTPFGLQDVSNGAKQLLAYGIASEEVNETLVRLGDIAAGLSIPLNDLVYLYGTTMTQGRMFTQDLRQFQGRGIPLADELAKQFGVTKDAVGELVTAGKVGFDEMNKAIISMTSEGGKFGGLMEAQSKTITGQISNIEDSIDTMFNEIGQSSEGAINLALEGVSSLIENYEKIGEAIGVMVTAYGSYKAALAVGIAIQKAEAAVTAEAAVQKSLAAIAGHTLSTAQARGAATAVLYANAQRMVVMSLKQLAAATILNPYVLIAAAITGVVYGVYKLATAETEAEKATRRHNEEMERQSKAFDERKGKIESLIGVIQNETETEYARIKAYEELANLSPRLVNAYSMEELATIDLADATKVLNQERDQLQYDTLTKEVADYSNTLKTLNEEFERIKKGGAIGQDQNYIINLMKSIETTEAYLNEARDQLNQINKLKKEAEQNKKPVEVRLAEAQSNREQILQEYNAAKLALEEAQKNLAESPFATIPIAIQLRFDNAQKDLNEVDKQIEGLQGSQESKKTYQTALKEAKAVWEAKRKALEDAKKGSQDDYIKAAKELEQAENDYKKLGGDTSNKDFKKDAQKRAEELLAIRRENQQKEINLMAEGTEKKKAQIEHDYQLEIDEIKKQKKEWEDAQKGTLTEEQKTVLGNKAANAMKVRESGLAKLTKEEADAAKLAMNEYLKEYGTWMDKRKAITEIYTEKISKAINEGEKLTLGEEMKHELAKVDDEVQSNTSTITKLFGDMSNKTVQDMRTIAEEAQTMLSYIESGNFKAEEGSLVDKFGFTKEQFEILKASPEKLEAIKNEIANVTNEADKAEPVLDKMAKALKEIFSGKTDKFDDKLNEIIGGVGAITQAAEFLGDSLSNISEAFGGNFLGGLAEGIGVATDAANAAMSGAEAGKVFGPWGAAAGAAIGLVSSLASSFSKLHDKKHERKIQEIAEQIEVLEKSYEKLGENIEKAYSNDASNLIKDQNRLLQQQKVLIQNQIKEEESKKKTDSNRIKEWQQQIEDINKTIEDNKEAAVDAIFGSDLQSAIEDFASAYTDAWGAGEDKAKSAKDMVKNMIKSMITESIKAAASDPMKAIREKLLEFWSDQYISSIEQERLNQMATDLQQELDRKFGWADSLMNDSTYSQEASSKGFQAMSQETGDELNGRFTALQISNEEIKNQMVQSVVLYTQMLSLTSQNNGILNDILTQHAISNGYLADLVKYSKAMSGYGEKIDKIVENTQNL